MNFEETIRALARRAPSMPLSDALTRIDKGGRTLAICLEGQDVVTVAEWIAGQDDIVALCGITDPTTSKKINAIKEVRGRAALGLKEAKEAVEYFIAHHEDITALKGEELERAAQEAIDSIARAHVTRDV